MEAHFSPGKSRFKNGHRKFGGRKKGVPNRATQYLGMATDLALSGDQNELIEYLIWLGLNQPRAYLKLLGKLL